MKMNSNFNLFVKAGEAMNESSYKTRQRALILDCLKQNEQNAYTIDEIVDLLKAQGQSVGRTTVYRYIDSLYRQGSIRRFERGGKNGATFQYISQKDSCKQHMHLKCVECGKLIHLDCDFMSGVCEHIYSHHGFIVDNSKTTLLGLCSSCAKERQKENETD